MAKNIQPKKYTTLSDIDHVLLRPEVHIGSTEPMEHMEYVVDENFTTISEKPVMISEALVRIFVEVLANAVDNISRSKGSPGQSPLTPCKSIKVEIDEDGRTMVYNDGQVIKVSKDENDGIEIDGKKYSLYNHELVFGHLRSSSNYDDTVTRETSGKNGLGVKCTNILSKSFKVIGVDPENRKKLVQEWTNNMKVTNGPTVSSCTAKVGYTEVTYYPDFPRFGQSGAQFYSGDAMGIFRKHVLDVAMLASPEGVSVYFNGKKLPIKKFSDYTKLFQMEKESVSITEEGGSSEVTIAFLGRPEGSSGGSGNGGDGRKKRPISFVNGLFTKDGGQHVDGWTKPFFAGLLVALNKPTRGKDKELKELKVSQKDLTPHFRFFVRSTVDKPKFDCQNKNMLKSPSLKYTVPDKVISKVCKWASVQELKGNILERMLKGKDTNVIKTLNDKKRRPKVSVKEYDPANNAGTSRSENCTLIVCEGLSAKTYAVAGINTGVSFDNQAVKRCSKMQLSLIS
jgi:DNA topoisomerase II